MTSLFGGTGYYGTRSGSGTTRTYPAAARSSARIGTEMPYSRIYPAHLLYDLPVVRARSKWLTRANEYATAAARDLPSMIIGSTGIMPGLDEPLWREWNGDPMQCHVEGRYDLFALQWMAARGVVVTGESFVVRRARRSDSMWPLPLQLMVFDGDAVQFEQSNMSAAAPGNYVQQGIEYNRRGQRVAYNFRIQRPGTWTEDTIRVPASDVVHLYDPLEAEMQRGAPWFAPTVIKLHDMDSFNEAALKKADVASKISAITSKMDGAVDPRMLPDPEADEDDQLEAPYELTVTPGSQVHIPEMPKGDSIKDYNEAALQGVSAALGLGFEALTGDYREMPFSSARMSDAKLQMRVRGWRRRWLKPAMMRVYEWAREAAAVRGQMWPAAMALEWPDPPRESIEPDKDGRASQQDVRNGFTTISEELRRRGKVPRRALEQYRDDLALLDELGLSLDSDPRRMTAQGQAQVAETEPAAAGAEA